MILNYGYAFKNRLSTITLNDFASRMEDSLIANLIGNGDTTGVAHLSNDVTEQFDDRTYPEKIEYIRLPVNRGISYTPIPSTSEDINFYFTQFFETNYAYHNCGDTITDSRDGQKYATVCIEEQIWMAENLNWAGAGVCYDDNSTKCLNYGRLYNIQEVTNLKTSTDTSVVRGI